MANKMASETIKENIVDIDLPSTVKKLFLAYAEETISSRALVKAQDGLKPVQRYILYSMYESGLKANAKPTKCAKVVGNVIGSYNPHGDQSAYDALTFLSQSWKMRYPLVDFVGNSGSQDGDKQAAMRYTECRLSKIGESMTEGLKKNAVDMKSNYDDTTEEPTFLAGIFPNLICNPTQGIAVGMSSSMAPHYAPDVFEAIKYTLKCMRKGEKPNEDDIIRIIKAPDFPTGGIITNPKEVWKAYKTGSGSIVIRARYHIEKDNNKEAIVFTEVPYNINKQSLLEQIGSKYYNSEDLDGAILRNNIADICDESEKGNIRIVFKLKKDANADIVVNNLYKKTALQSSFAINNTLLVNSKPVSNASLFQLIQTYCISHLQSKARMVKYDLDQYVARQEIVSGMAKCCEMLNEVIETIRASKTHNSVIEDLIAIHGFTENQAKAIDARKLGSLNKMDVESIADELKELSKNIEWCKKMLADKGMLIDAFLNDIDNFLAKGYFNNDKRRTEVQECSDGIEDRDLIEEQNIVMFYTHNNMVKAIKSSDYNTQRRAGFGTMVKLRENDFVETVLYISNKDDLLVITNKGKAYLLPAYRIPVVTKNASGKYLSNYLEFEDNERVVKIVSVKHGEASKEMLFATQKGFTKRIALEGLTIRKSGTRVIKIDEGDKLASVILVEKGKQIMFISHNGFAVRTEVENVSLLGRNTRGNIAMRFKSEDDYIVNAAAVTESDTLLVVNENGMAKRMPVATFRLQAKGGKGTAASKEKVCKAFSINENNSLFVITSNDRVIRVPADSIRETKGRSSKGVKLIKLEDNEKIITVISAPKDE